MSVDLGVRRRVRWGVRHGLFRQLAARSATARAGLLLTGPDVADPYPAYRRLREQGELVHAGAVWATARHDVCAEVLRRDDFGVEFRLQQLPALRLALRLARDDRVLGAIEPPSLLAVDPPHHTRMRRLVVRAFSAKAVARLRTRTEEIAAELLDGIAARAAGGEPVDLAREYAGLLPVTVIAELLGVPTAMRERFLEWGGGAALSLELGLDYARFRRSERDLMALQSWMRGHLDRLRRDPGDDLLSTLVTQHDDELTDTELVGIAMLLLAAGFETTVNLIGSGVVLLVRHPGQLDALRADPSRWPNAVEEVLRHDAPVQRTARTALHDVELRGERFRTGTPIVTMLGGANRDPAVFADPDRFDVTRADAREHLAFSAGAHYCLGAMLARMEGEVGLRALFDRFSDVALTGPPSRRRTRVLRGYDSIPATVR